MKEIIEKLKHLPDDRIGDGIFSAFEWSEKTLVRIYLGSIINGPMLQWYKPTISDDQEYTIVIGGIETVIKPHMLYNGITHIDFKSGAWTNCYSRGNFGKKYALGGNWSGHTKNLHPRLMESPIRDENFEMITIEGEDPIILPSGIKGDVSVTSMDSSGSWNIWYTTAKIALTNRLTRTEIQESSLPSISKQHLLQNETEKVIEALQDVIETYKL